MNREARIDVRYVALTQRGRAFVFAIRTQDQVALSRLRRFPDFSSPTSAGAPYLCLSLRSLATAHESRLCLGGTEQPTHRVGLSRVDRTGRIVDRETIRARIRRPKPRKLVVRVIPEQAQLAPGKYEWQIEASGCLPRHSCPDALPDNRYGRYRLRPVRAVGCTGGDAQLVHHGSRAKRVIALTFDDGPSTYTPDFLRVLRAKHVHATFFQVGYEMAGDGAVMRQILAQGSEIGNHSFRHDAYPGYFDLDSTSDRIKKLTHFRPCVFRPPGGSFNSAVVAAAGQAGMKTIIWDSGPFDYLLPGSSVIYSRVVNAARPGSIIVMHDGGGPRSQTLAALPDIIDTLRQRGYRFATVSQLLGERVIYQPFG